MTCIAATCSEAMVGLGGVTARLTSVAPVTVRVVEPDMMPEVAVIVLSANADRRGQSGGVDGRDADRPTKSMITWVVRSCVVPSENMPVAVNCSVVPSGFVGLGGVMEIEDNVAAGDGEHRRAAGRSDWWR